MSTSASTPPTVHEANLQRLLKRLAPGSLSRQLVEAYANPGTATPIDSARSVLLNRLTLERQNLDGS